MPRRSGAAVLMAALVLGTGGCAAFNRTFGQQEAVVHFTPGTTQQAQLRVRAACSHLPNATPEPLPTDHIASDRLYDVRYRVGGASDAQLARLEQCLQKYPSVAGIDISTPGGN